LTQKKQKVKAEYKFYTDVRLGKGSQNKAWELGNNILTAREAGVLLHTCLRCLPSATSVVKFLLGRSLHPDAFYKTQIHVPQCCPKLKCSKKRTA
jgi:hypothetical protein